MDCIDRFLSKEESDQFWFKMSEAEQIFFPSGRPVAEAKAEGCLDDLIESEETKKLIGDDPLLSEVMKQVASSGALPNGEEVDMGDIMQNAKFIELAANVTKSLTSGKYTKDNLEKTVDTLTGLVGDDVDPELKKMIAFLKQSVKDIKAGKPANLGPLVQMISSFNTGLDLEPVMQMMRGMPKR